MQEQHEPHNLLIDSQSRAAMVLFRTWSRGCSLVVDLEEVKDRAVSRSQARRCDTIPQHYRESHHTNHSYLFGELYKLRSLSEYRILAKDPLDRRSKNEVYPGF